MISYTGTAFENSGHFIPQGCCVFTSRDNTEIQHQQVKPLINAGTGAPSIHWDGGYKPEYSDNTEIQHPNQCRDRCPLNPLWRGYKPGVLCWLPHLRLPNCAFYMYLSYRAWADGLVQSQPLTLCRCVASLDQVDSDSFLIFTHCPISCFLHVKTQLTKMTCISLSVYKQTSEASQ